jgi:hypothetical protein
VCLVHANMTAVVHVLPLSQPLPHNQGFYDDLAAAERHDLLSDTDHGGHHGRPRSPENQVTAGIGEISATAGGSETLSVMRFMRPKTVIHAGETVLTELPFINNNTSGVNLVEYLAGRSCGDSPSTP